jgi:hypothetical protein
MMSNVDKEHDTVAIAWWHASITTALWDIIWG